MSDVARLYRYFKPSRYELYLAPDKAKSTFNGQVTINGKLEAAQKRLRLHCKELKITEVSINGEDRKFSINNKLDELVIESSQDTDQDLSVSITFSGLITKPMHGLYPCTGRDGETILATQFESHHAREVFPCVDEPEAKAIFSLKLTTNKDDVVLANTDPLEEDFDQALKTTLFEDTPLMSTYLLAFVVGKLDFQETTTHDGVFVRAWATPDQAANTSFALDIATKSLEFFNDYFEVPYPLNKCDIVALPDFAAGAMENWGLLTFRETCMLVDPANTSLDNQQYVAMVVAHEVAHQWFGNLVTMRWWNDLWLNEGFASWIEFMAIDKIFPQWHMWTHFIATEQDSAFRLDALTNTHAIEVEVPDPDEIHSIFDTISYSKGACMIHMLHGYLGSNNFRLGLAHYLKKYAYKNTETIDLWDALTEVSGLPVAEFIGSWTKQVGFPYIRLEKSGSKLKLIQERFLSDGRQAKSKDVWPIPLLSDDLQLSILDKKQQVVDIKVSDIKLNNNQAGFYIVKYWPEAYLNVSNKIKNNQLSETERIGLVSDMLALVKAGHLTATLLLETLKQFNDETSEPVWSSIAGCLADIRHVLGDDVRQKIKPFTRRLIDEQLNRLGWHESKDESHYDRLLRPLILGFASGADHLVVLSEAKKRFDSAANISDIDSNLRNMIIASVSHRGGEYEYGRLLEMLQSSSSPEDKVILAHGLSNFRHPAQYKASLKLIKTDLVRLQDVHYWLIYSLANPEARDATWDWIKSNWSWIRDNLKNDSIYLRLPVYVAKAYNKNEFLKAYQDFFDNIHEPAIERSIKQGVDIIEFQSAWRVRDEQAVLDWLNNNFTTQV